MSQKSQPRNQSANVIVGSAGFSHGRKLVRVIFLVTGLDGGGHVTEFTLEVRSQSVSEAVIKARQNLKETLKHLACLLDQDEPGWP